METVNLTRNYELIECSQCGCSFALLEGFVNMLRRSGRDFYCPSTWGHSMAFPRKEPKPRVETVIKEIEVEKIVEVERKPKDIPDFYRNHDHMFGNGKNKPCKTCGVFQAVVEIITDPPT